MSSYALSAMSYSVSTVEKLPKLAVSTASTPTSKNAACIASITSGRVRQSISLQPSRSAPPKSSAVEVEVLDVRAERAVEDDDPLGDGIEVGCGLMVAQATGGPRRMRTPACGRSASVRTDRPVCGPGSRRGTASVDTGQP